MINIDDYNDITQGEWIIRKTVDDSGDYTYNHYDVLVVIESKHGKFSRVICREFDNPNDALLVSHAPKLLNELVDARLEIEELKTKIDDLCGL